MVAPEQQIRTGAVSFWITAICGWLMWTWMMYQWFDNIRYESSWLAVLLLIPCLATAWGVAAVGAVLCLAGGAKLSRHFCWFFAIPIGFWMPAVSVFLYFIASEVVGNALGRWTSMALGPMFMVTFLIASFIAGVAIGIILTRKRVGFATAAKSGARMGFALGTTAALCIALVTYFAARSRNSWLLSDSAFIEPGLIGFGMIVTIGMIIGALWRAEKPESRGFQVLPAIPLSAPEIPAA